MALTKNEIIELIKSENPLIKDSIDLEVQLQPAGVDLTVREIYSFESAGRIDFTNKERVLSKIKPLPFNKDGWLYLKPGVYLVRFNEIVNIPNDVIAIGKPRSSLLRMGAFMITAVWDPGYKGRSVSLLVVLNPHGIYIKKNARVLQLIFIKLRRKTESYRGVYQFEGIERER